MKITTLEPLKEEELANRAEIMSLFFPLVRGGMWSFIPVYFTYLLFKEWGQVFPSILWTMPLLLPPMFFLIGILKLWIPAKYIFTEKALEERSGNPKKVKWKNVDGWWIEHKGEWLYVVFITGFLSRVRFRFHKNRGEDYITNLIKQYGKI